MKIVCSLLVFALSMQCSLSNWTQRADFGAVGRHRGTGCSIGNKGYIGLGHYNGTGSNIVKKDWWEYDPATNAWTQKADYNGAGGSGNYAVLILSIGNYAYVTGGTFSDVNTRRYSPVTNLWEIVATCPINPSNTEGFVIGDKGYFVNSNAVYEFNATTSTWTQKGNAPFVANAWLGAFSIGEKGYIRTTSGFYEYKQSLDQWVNRAYFPGLATAASMNFTQDGKGYVVCGYGFGLSDVNSEVWEYDPLQNSWNQFEDFPGTSRRFGVGFSIGDRAYVGIGTNGTNFNDFWEFDADMYLGSSELTDISIEAFPNPVVDHFTVSCEQYPNFEIALFSANGMQVFQTNTSSGKVQIQRNGLPSGTYFVKLISDGRPIGSQTLLFQ